MNAESDPDYVQVNKKHWDAIAERGNPERAKYLKLIGDGYPYLEKVEPKISEQLGNIKGKRIIVPQFGDGLVLLACAKKGASVTGVDLSSRQVQRAKEAARQCGVKVNIIEADWQRLPKSIRSNSFDIVVTECGIFIWIQDLDVWMTNAYRVLRKDGRLIVSDFHPIARITEGWRGEGPLSFTGSYFDQRPHVHQENDAPPSIEFTWKLSDIINAVVDAGFHIDCIEEYYVKEKVAKISLIPTDFLIAATKK